MVKRRIKSINRRAVLEPQTTGTDDSRKQNTRIYDEWKASGISDSVVRYYRTYLNLLAIQEVEYRINTGKITLF